jgi:outer membrane protein OmpA-like peptidoglycan-associated protein
MRHIAPAVDLTSDLIKDIKEELEGNESLKFEYVAETYDAVTILALAEFMARCGRVSTLADQIVGVTRDRTGSDEECGSYAECLERMKGQYLDNGYLGINYDGLGGEYELGASGQPEVASFRIFTHGNETDEQTLYHKKGCLLCRANRFPMITFAENRHELSADARTELNYVRSLIRSDDIERLYIHGYASFTPGGNPSHDRDLSQKRADAVKQYLISLGVPEDTMEAEGKGQTQKFDENRAVVFVLKQ